MRPRLWLFKSNTNRNRPSFALKATQQVGQRAEKQRQVDSVGFQLRRQSSLIAIGRVLEVESGRPAPEAKALHVGKESSQPWCDPLLQHLPPQARQSKPRQGMNETRAGFIHIRSVRADPLRKAWRD